MFIIWKTDYFQLCFLYKGDLHIFNAGKHIRIIRILNTFEPKNDNIFKVIDQKKFLGYRCISGIFVNT